ncbi:THAP domain-containing protein [Pimephales promelas]|nr:THAP domain-containing protein [Pimephales promelas]
MERDPDSNFKISAYTKVCSEHFLPDCIVKSKTGITKLKRGAVPTVFAWSVVRTASTPECTLDDGAGRHFWAERHVSPRPP